MKHILITSDLSDESLRPFEMVSRLADSLGARVTLLYIVQELVIAPHGSPLAPPITSPDIHLEVEEARESLKKQAAALGDAIPVEPVVISSPRIPTAISHYAKEHDVDLIAISTHGRTGWRHLALGSVAEEVMRHSEVPVLCFPRDKKDKKDKKK